jgi:ketopantoate reductase
VRTHICLCFFSTGRNCCWNTLGALTLLDTAQILHSSESALPVAKALIEEMASIARALGYEIEDAYLEDLTQREAVWKGITSSMYADAKHKRPMEVEVRSERGSTESDETVADRLSHLNDRL